MKHRVLTPIHEPALMLQHQLTFPFLMQAHAVGNFGYPLQGTVNWYENSVQLPEWDQTPEFWSPYGIAPNGQAYFKPWASLAFGYIYRGTGIELPSLTISEWKQNVANLISDMVFMDRPVANACTIMVEDYLEPRGEKAERLERHEKLVMYAMDHNRMEYDRKRAADLERRAPAFWNSAP